MLPAPLQRTWLSSALAALLEEREQDMFVTTPIVRATDEFFPDRWTADQAGVTALARRLLGYAGLGNLGVSVEMFTGETEVEEVGMDGTAPK